MKTMLKCWLFMFITVLSSCEEKSKDVIEKTPPSIKTTVVHNADRTTISYTDVAGYGVVLPAGNYDVIRFVGDGDVTLSNGVKFNKFNHMNQQVQITIPTGAVVTCHKGYQLFAGATIVNNGTFYVNGSCDMNGTFINIGRNYNKYRYNIGGNYNQSILSPAAEFDTITVSTHSIFQFTGVSSIGMGKAKTYCWLQQIPANPYGIIAGKGRMYVGNGGMYVYQGPVTRTTDAKVCLERPAHFQGTGNIGIGSISCP